MTRERAAPSDLHSAWARLFVRALARAGARDVVISPGSRSTPLVLAAAAEPGVRCHTVLDERAAAFFALGQGRATGRPSVLLCTSGTAGAHYLPAVIEAAQSFVPLVCVTADRPWEAYDAAAPQTIDQVKLFGGHVRHYAELGLPDPTPVALRAVPRVAAQAVARALGPIPGPVHVNARFRKPLEPVDVPDGAPEPWADELARLLAAGAPAVFAARSVIVDDAAIAELAAVVARARRGLIVCGPRGLADGDGDDDEGAALGALARSTGFPVLAEATSQVRFGRALDGVARSAAFDAVLRDGAFRAGHRADVILEFGAPPVSGAYAAYVAELDDVARYVIAPHGWSDPPGGATGVVFGQAADTARRLAARLDARAAAAPERAAWAAAFAGSDAVAWEVAARVCSGGDDATLSEAVVARALLDVLPARSVVVVGNSSPVRDLDTWCAPGGRALRVVHQRGASGIDGLLAGAAGVRSATDAPAVALLIGDLSLLHDLTSLGVARAVGGRLLVVAVQNGGGRIFEALPIAARAELGVAFERHFITPQSVDLVAAASAFGVPAERVGTVGAYRVALARALAADAPVLIEAVVPAHDGAARRGALYRETSAALAGSRRAL